MVTEFPKWGIRLTGPVFFLSQKDLENLKAEVQRRQQLQELGKIEEPTEDSPLELEDKIPID